MKIKKSFIFVLIVLTAIGGALVVSMNKSNSTINKAQVVYHCPMHPTYTSNKPGDCPICNMKLVKNESADSSVSKGNPQKAKDICYMHNCPMMKKGQKCPMMVVAKTGEAITCPVCGTHVAETGTTASSEKKILYWTDPMLPGFKADKPGKSPMGMDLIPVYEEGGGISDSNTATPQGYVPILVTPQKRQFIGVRTAKVEKRVISKTIRAVGRIAYDPELYQAEQETISSIRAWKESEKNANPDITANAKRLMESSQMRLRLLGLNKELIDEVAAWEGPDKSLLLTDPNGKAWLYAPIYEYELPLVKVGQTISVEISATLGKTLTGTIRSIDSVLDPMTRTARVRAVLVDPDGGLKPEMFVNASIAVNSGEVLAIPEEAVFNTGTKQIVFVDKSEGIFEPRDVKVGFKTEGFYELKDGVLEGESVVTSGNFLIDSESRLKAALEGMAPPPVSPHHTGVAGSSVEGGPIPAESEETGGGVGEGGGHLHGQ